VREDNPKIVYSSTNCTRPSSWLSTHKSK